LKNVVCPIVRKGSIMQQNKRAVVKITALEPEGLDPIFVLAVLGLNLGPHIC
jgi:hypothetical protein